jgi:hypothetical protein
MIKASSRRSVMIPERPGLEGDRLKPAGLHLSELTPPTWNVPGPSLHPVRDNERSDQHGEQDEQGTSDQIQ